jgi:hypothetical protein
VEDTIAEIRQQINKAAEGSLVPVTKMQTASGIKDRVAQGWIIHIIDEVRRRRAEDISQPLQEIKAQVLQWLADQTKEPWNPLLSMPGE